jgi:DNA-binding SARP family transcriptional activator
MTIEEYENIMDDFLLFCDETNKKEISLQLYLLTNDFANRTINHELFVNILYYNALKYKLSNYKYTKNIDTYENFCSLYREYIIAQRKNKIKKILKNITLNF